MIIQSIWSQLVKAMLAIWAWFCTWLTPFWIITYVIAGSVPQIMIIYQKRHLKGTPELNKKYHAFVRLDYPHWSYVKICIMSLLTLHPVRCALGIGIKVIYVIIAFFAMLGTDPV